MVSSGMFAKARRPKAGCANENGLRGPQGGPRRLIPPPAVVVPAPNRLASTPVIGERETGALG
jgi:hypothetical protein